jgi:hypothetical protein
MAMARRIRLAPDWQASAASGKPECQVAWGGRRSDAAVSRCARGLAKRSVVYRRLHALLTLSGLGHSELAGAFVTANSLAWRRTAHGGYHFKDS